MALRLCMGSCLRRRGPSAADLSVRPLPSAALQHMLSPCSQPQSQPPPPHPPTTTTPAAPLCACPGVGQKEMNSGERPVIGMADVLNGTGAYTMEIPCPRSRATATIRVEMRDESRLVFVDEFRWAAAPLRMLGCRACCGGAGVAVRGAARPAWDDGFLGWRVLVPVHASHPWGIRRGTAPSRAVAGTSCSVPPCRQTWWQPPPRLVLPRSPRSLSFHIHFYRLLKWLIAGPFIAAGVALLAFRQDVEALPA